MKAPTAIRLILILTTAAAAAASNGKRSGGGRTPPPPVKPPVAAKSSFDFYFDYFTLEEQPVSNLIGNVIIDFGLDLKYNQTVLAALRFSFLTRNNPHNRFFSIENQTGVIRTRSRIDREAICPGVDHCSLKMDIAVQPLKYFQILQVRVEILDVNDNSPVFREARLSQQVSESAELGSGFALPQAVDADSVRNGIRSYELVPVGSKFELQVHRLPEGGSALKMIVKTKLDREAIDAYHLAVYAVDGGIPPKTGSLAVDIVVLDANDNRPEFTRSLYEVWTREDTQSGTILLTVQALDRDKGENAHVVYDLSTQSAQEFGRIFGIGPESGMVYLKGSLDYESTYTYALSVMAKDRGPDAVPSYTSVAVHVEDINDNGPVITVNTLTSNGQAEVTENSEVGAFVSHLSVTDSDLGDNGRVHCSVGDSRFKLLRIYRSEFKVVTGSVLDRETRSVHTMTITCFDHGDPPLTASANLTVTVLDDNDHSPRFDSNEYSISIDENNQIGDVLLTVHATDEDSGDNGAIVYHMSASSSSFFSSNRYFRIDPRTGTVFVDVILDRETDKFLEIDVTAEDLGKPRRTATSTVKVTILDVDDEDPQFIREHFEFSVFENSPSGTTVGTVVAFDRDDIPLHSFSYDIDRWRSPWGVFVIDSESGVITTATGAALDRETQPHYALVVLARPVGPGTRQSAVGSCSVAVQVADVNDNRPRFTFPGSGNSQLSVPRGASAGSVIGRLEARDVDSPANAKMTFSAAMTSSTENGSGSVFFEVNPRTGELLLTVDAVQLTGGSAERLRLRVSVRDDAEPSFVDYAVVVIVFDREAERAVATGDISSSSSILASETLLVFLAITLSVILVAIVIVAVVLCTIHRRICLERRAYELTATDEKLFDQCRLTIFIDGVSKNGNLDGKESPVGQTKTASRSSNSHCLHCLCCATDKVYRTTTSNRLLAWSRGEGGG